MARIEGAILRRELRLLNRALPPTIIEYRFSIAITRSRCRVGRLPSLIKVKGPLSIPPYPFLQAGLT